MRVEVTIGGEALVWEMSRKAQMRAEIALALPWGQIAASAVVSSAIKAQLFYSGFSYPDGRGVPESVIDDLGGKDQPGLEAVVRAIAGAMGMSPLAEAPLSGNSDSGAASDSIPPVTG